MEAHYYWPSVLIVLLWGLWFLHVPGGKQGHVGLHVKYILFVLVLSLIPYLNLILLLVSMIMLIVWLCEDGWDDVFPNWKVTKWSKFFNYKFLE